MGGDSSGRFTLEKVLTFSQPVHCLVNLTDLGQYPRRASDHGRKLDDDICGPVHRDPVLDEGARLHPVAFGEMEHTRDAVGDADGVGMRRLRKADRLGYIPGRLSELAELGETHDQPGAIKDRRWYDYLFGDP